MTNVHYRIAYRRKLGLAFERGSRALVALAAFGLTSYLLVLCLEAGIGASPGPDYRVYATVADRAWCASHGALFAGTVQAMSYEQNTGGSVEDGNAVCLFCAGMQRHLGTGSRWLSDEMIDNRSGARSFSDNLAAPLIQVVRKVDAMFFTKSNVRSNADVSGIA
jgi:hypothetical protein